MSYIDWDLNLMKVFMSVYENGSIIAASRKLYVSQPAVTNSIKKLEQSLGGELFVRTPKGVIPTTEGEIFYDYCKKAINAVNQGVNIFSEFSQLEKGVLNIGSSSTIIRHLLLPFITEFSTKFPNIKISITDGISTQLMDYLQRGDVDLIILNTPIDNMDKFNSTNITATKDCFIVSKDFTPDFVSKNDLKNYNLILQKRPSNNRDFFEQMCLENNVILTPNLEMASFGLITDFTEKGIGIGYTIKDFVKKDLKAGKVKELNTDFKIKERNVVVLTPGRSVNSFACKQFINELLNYFKNKEI